MQSSNEVHILFLLLLKPVLFEIDKFAVRACDELSREITRIDLLYSANAAALICFILPVLRNCDTLAERACAELM